MLQFIVKNTTNADIEVSDTGATVPANDQINVDKTKQQYWAKEDTIAIIDSLLADQSLIINDGITDLSYTEALRYIRGFINFYEKDGSVVIRHPSNINFTGSVSTSIDEVNGKITYDVGTTDHVFSLILNNTGNSENKWLEIFSSSSPSNMLPWISPYASQIKTLTYSNKNNDSSIDIEFYKNGSYLSTVEIRGKRTYWNTTLTNLNYQQGDRLSVFCRKVSGYSKPKDVVLQLLMEIGTINSATGGTNSQD